jgi:predicted DNA-binding transcriptional regulator AlpA
MAGQRIDVADLLDAGEVAELLGLARRQGVSTYRSRYADFPQPVVTKNSGKCDLWLRADVEAWAARRRSPRS